ncbi:MAG: DUF3499 domain-containing protein [Actinomycetota bacterium]|nr:DUF3499 domain-containing protein [Actinomycetota bacterium]
MNHCSKPGCAQVGGAVLTYDYDARLAFLDDPIGDRVSPHAYVLCVSCADRLDPPRGWLLDDRRSEPPLFVPHVPDEDLIGAVAHEPSRETESASVRSQLFFGHSGA